jgi:hypothetical protein
MSETVSLKVLARRIIERDTNRDNERDGMSRQAVSAHEPARHAQTVPIVPSALIAAQSAAVVPITTSGPGLEQPCASRRGQVLEVDGVFLHFCCRCGRFGAFGYGAHLKAGRLGSWYCREHRPDRGGKS